MLFLSSLCLCIVVIISKYHKIALLLICAWQLLGCCYKSRCESVNGHFLPMFASASSAGRPCSGLATHVGDNRPLGSLFVLDCWSMVRGHIWTLGVIARRGHSWFTDFSPNNKYVIGVMWVGIFHNVNIFELDQGHLACRTQFPLPGPVAVVFTVIVVAFIIVVVLFVVVLVIVVLVVVSSLLLSSLLLSWL